MSEFTHDDLVARCGHWLRSSKHKCPMVFEEPYSVLNEIPDVIGFKVLGQSYLIECKATRSDFLADKKKRFRKKPETGMGMYRYYACPKGLIEKKEVPSNWGLIYVYPNQIRIIKRPTRQKHSMENEWVLVMTLLKKIHFMTDVPKLLKDYTAGLKAMKKPRKNNKTRRRYRRKSK